VMQVMQVGISSRTIATARDVPRASPRRGDEA
jgi:hypothetical protein